MTKRKPRKQLTSVSLFSGIGGLEKGLMSAGHETLLQCEVLDTARAVLREQFPEVALRRDVTTLRSLPDVDLVTAGFPCQDLSQAGRSNGIHGTKSSLVDFVFDLLRKKRQKPEWVLLENVPFMLQLNRGEAIRHVVNAIEELGYSWAYRVVDTRSFGIPQRRRRVVFLAARTEDPKQVLFADDVGYEPFLDAGAAAHGFYWTEGNRGLGWTHDGVPTLKGGSGISIPSPPAIWLRSENRIVTPGIRDAERLQGFPPNWTRAAERVPGVRKEAVRWKLVGNAVSVPVARWIGKRLSSPGEYDGSNDLEFNPTKTWPACCWGNEGKTFVADVSEWPKRQEYRSLSTFLRFRTKPLSLRATSGFFSRLQASTLKRPAEFDEALVSHIETMQDAKASIA